MSLPITVEAEPQPELDPVPERVFAVSSFVESEAVESDGEGGDASLESETPEVETDDESDDSSLAAFVAADGEDESATCVTSDDDDDAEADSAESDSEDELLALEREFGVNSDEAKRIDDSANDHSEYESEIESESDIDIDIDADADMADETDSADDSERRPMSSTGAAVSKSKPSLSIEEMKEIGVKQLSRLSVNELDTLLNDLALESAICLTEMQREDRLDDAFASQQDLITTTEHRRLKQKRPPLDIDSFLLDSSMISPPRMSSDGSGDAHAAPSPRRSRTDSGNSVVAINRDSILKSRLKSRAEVKARDEYLKGMAMAFASKDFMTVEKNYYDISGSSGKSKLSTMIVEKEEEKFARNVLARRGISMRQNLEAKERSAPLSKRDNRQRVEQSADGKAEKRSRDHLGKRWFYMPRGELSMENKLHFLMVKYRHLLYSKRKAIKDKTIAKAIPKYFEMGRIVDGPADYYRGGGRFRRKKDSKQTWSQEYMSNPRNKAYINRRTDRVLRAKQAKQKHRKFAPVNSFSFGEKYRIRKKLVKNRRFQRKKKFK